MRQLMLELRANTACTTLHRLYACRVTARSYATTPTTDLPAGEPAVPAAAPAATSEGSFHRVNVRRYAAASKGGIHRSPPDSMKDGAAESGTIREDEGTVKENAVENGTVKDGDVKNDAVHESTREPRIKTEFAPNYFSSQLGRHKGEQNKLSRHISRLKPRDPDLWKYILRILDQATPTNHLQYKRIVEIATLPKDVVAVFEPSTELAVLEIMQQTGCHIQLAAGYAVEGRSNAFTAVVLQGTYAQNSSALSLLPKYVNVSSRQTAQTIASLTRHDIQRTLQTDGAAEATARPKYWQIYEDESTADPPKSQDLGANKKRLGSGALVRSVWARERVQGRPQQPFSSLQRDLSSLQTPADFTAYAEDLISMRVGVISQQERRHQNGKPTNWQIDHVMDALVSLFTSPAMSHLSTTESISRAFEFLAKHRKFAALRQIMQSLNDTHRDIGIRGFDALLSAAADASDVHHFEQVLVLMRRHGLKPAASTWASMHTLMCRRMPDEANVIPILMRDKGLLRDNISLLTIIKNEVRQHLVAHIHEGGDVAGFLTTYSTRVHTTYGRPDFTWLGVDVLNRMLDLLIDLGRTKEAVFLLEHFRREGIGPPETSTLNTFLSSTSHDYDATSAIATLGLFRVGHDFAVMPDHITYQMLFMIAWRKRYYNVLRVVWRYACVAGQVSPDMHRRMIFSLKSYSPMSADQVGLRSMFKAWAAIFAVGVARDLIPLAHEQKPPNALGDDERRLVELGCQEKLEKDSAESEARAREMKRLAEDDEKEAGSCKPVLPLIYAFRQALLTDLRWQERRVEMPESLTSSAGRQIFQWMMSNGIRVPMKPGDFSKFRKWEISSRLGQSLVLEANQFRRTKTG